MKTDTIIHSEKRFYISLAVVAVLHVLLLAAAIYLQLRHIPQRDIPKIVTITLISAPPSSGEQGSSTNTEQADAVMASSDSQPVVTKDVKKVTAKPVLVIKKTGTVHPSSSEKNVEQEKSAVQSGVERSQVSINKALEHIKQRVDGQAEQQQSRSSLNNALERLQQKLKAEKAAAGSGSASGGNSSGTGKVASGGGLSYTYQANIKKIIQNNWQFSKTFLKSSEGMEVYVRIHILADGTINQIIFDKKAASDYLNNSITKAIEKSSPLPALPKEYGTDNLWIGFVFTPAGIGSSR